MQGVNGFGLSRALSGASGLRMIESLVCQLIVTRYYKVICYWNMIILLSGGGESLQSLCGSCPRAGCGADLLQRDLLPRALPLCLPHP